MPETETTFTLMGETAVCLSNPNGVPAKDIYRAYTTACKKPCSPNSFIRLTYRGKTAVYLEWDITGLASKIELFDIVSELVG